MFGRHKRLRFVTKTLINPGRTKSFKIMNLFFYIGLRALSVSPPKLCARRFSIASPILYYNKFPLLFSFLFPILKNANICYQHHASDNSFNQWLSALGIDFGLKWEWKHQTKLRPRRTSCHNAFLVQNSSPHPHNLNPLNQTDKGLKWHFQKQVMEELAAIKKTKGQKGKGKGKGKDTGMIQANQTAGA